MIDTRWPNVVRLGVTLALVTVMVTYTAISHGENYGHYTGWNLTMCLAYSIVAGVWPRHAPYVLPSVLASAVTVVFGVVVLYGLRSSLIARAYESNPHPLVDFMNVVLHGSGYMLVAGDAAVNLRLYARTVTAYDAHVILSTIPPLVYLTLFDITDVYGLTWPTRSDASAAFALTCAASCGIVCAVLWLAYVPPSKKRL